MSRFTHLNNALSKLRSSEAPREVAFAVQKTNLIDDANARLLIEVPVAHQRYLNDQSMSVAVASAYPQVRYLPGSLYRENGTNLYGCFVRRAARTMSMEQASANGLQQVSDTVFQDASDQIWSKVGTGDQAYLSVNLEEDIASLLGAVRTRAIATASVGVQLSEDFEGGNMVYYYDLNRETASLGLAHDGRRVYDETVGALVEVSSDQVIYVHTQNTPETAAVGDGNTGQLLNYYKTLFGNHPEYFKRIREIIAQVLKV